MSFPRLGETLLSGNLLFSFHSNFQGKIKDIIRISKPELRDERLKVMARFRNFHSMRAAPQYIGVLSIFYWHFEAFLTLKYVFFS